jgi:hypothetical protein
MDVASGKLAARPELDKTLACLGTGWATAGCPALLRFVHFDTRLRGHRDDRSAIGMQQCREGLARQMMIGQESNASSWIQDTNAAGGL